MCVYGIGGISIGLSFEPPGFNFNGIEIFDNFIIDAQPEVVFTVYGGRLPDITNKGTLIFDTNINWYLWEGQGKKILSLRSRDRDPSQLAIFTPNFRTADVYIQSSRPGADYFYFPLSNPMGVVFMINLLAQGYGVLLHACGVVDQGKGMVFAGFGETGKSTTARLWAGQNGVSVLNDDCVLVRKVNGKFWVYGTPWHGVGGMALSEGAPLDKIFFLKQSEQNKASLLSSIHSTSALIARSFAPYWDAQGMDFTLQIMEDICQAIPCYELEFTPEQSIVDYVRCL